MIFADKMITLRKKNGWSQEDLAARMNVSRQAVAKWECAQAMPSLDKILLLSQMFGVTTDYLLKDEVEEVIYEPEDSGSVLRPVSLQMAHDYIANRRIGSVKLAIGVALCILSPTILFGLGAVSEFTTYPVSEETAAGIGLISLLLIVAVAVGLFVWDDQDSKPWKFLDAGEFTLDYGVKGMVQEQQRQFARTKLTYNVIGGALCILSPIPVFCAPFFGETFLGAMMVDLLLLMVAAGVTMLILAGTVSDAMDRLLQEGEFSPGHRRQERVLRPVSRFYWLMTTAIYLLWSFLTNNWSHTWIIWPVAGVVFAALYGILKAVMDSRVRQQ